MRKILLLIIAVMISATAISQTPYEKKCSQIFMKYWNIFTHNQPMSKSDEIAMREMVGVYENAKSYLHIASLNYMMETGKDPEPLLKQMEKEYTAARSLMNQREKTNFRIEEERKTNLGKQKWDAISKFLNWCQKDEYETTEKYEERLKNESTDAFDNIMYRQIVKFMEENPWTFEYGTYDADNQKLYVKFYDKIKENSLSGILNCPPENAAELKSGCNSYGKFPECQNEDFLLELRCGLQFGYDLTNILTDGQDVCPGSFYIRSKFGDYSFDNSTRNFLKPLTISYDAFKLHEIGTFECDKYMKGYVFDFQKFITESKEEAKHIADSLNAKINAKIDEYDNILSQNKFNIKEYTMKDGYELIFERYTAHFSQNADLSDFTPLINGTFKTILSQKDEIFPTKLKYADEAFEKIKSVIDKDFNDAYFDFSLLYNSKDEFAEYYCQGLQKLTAENQRREKKRREEEKLRSEEREVNLKLEQNRQAIANVDFQKGKSNFSFANAVTIAAGGNPTDHTDENKYRSELISWVNSMKGKPYYDSVIDFLMVNNAGLKNEYAKSGSYFSSKTEFYEAYSGGNYKAVLKSKK